jgi:hypothetical protein
VNKKQPFLTGFSSNLFGSAKRSAQAIFQDKVQQFGSTTISGLSMVFEKELPASELSQHCSSKRKRIYDESTTLWAWCSQILESNASCHKAVSNVQAWRQQLELPVPSAQTKAYCEARKRLPKSFIEQANKYVLKKLDDSILSRDRWQGLQLKAIDGSSMQLMDTEENQLAYPQPNQQKEGCGFPVMGVCGVVNLSHGGWETLSTSAHTQHDLSATYDVLESFGKDDLCLADRAYNSYEFMCLLKAQGSESLMRLHQARKRSLDWKKGAKLGKNDRLYKWMKPKRQSPGSKLKKEEWDSLPESMEVRITRFKYQKRDGKTEWMYLASSLLDTVSYPYEDLCERYYDRWVIELKFRDIKTMLEMEFIRAKTPELAEKTVLILQLCYNMIYSLIQSARRAYHVDNYQISFKHCIDQVLSQRGNYKGHHKHCYKREELHEKLLFLLSEELLVIRKGRHEPRAKKRRPKNHQLLTKPRHQFKEIQHRNSYKKTA